MKYKNIPSAIHNHGHSFLSSMNYVDGVHVVDEITRIRSHGFDIEINWLSGEWVCGIKPGESILKSIEIWRRGLAKHLESHKVDLACLRVLKQVIPARGDEYMVAVDDRGREYKVIIRETR